MSHDDVHTPTPEPGPITVLVLTEVVLDASDTAHLTSLHAAAEPRPEFRVLVPADTDRNVVIDFIDHLSMLELKEAWHELTQGAPDPRRAQRDAAAILAGSVSALEAAGATASGVVVSDDPIPALREELRATDAIEIVVVTQPHVVADTFHTDWASRARDDLGVPVLHFYTGTSFVG